MSMLSEQVKELRLCEEKIKDNLMLCWMSKIFGNAADTIETLSAKLATVNMERSSRYYCEDKSLIETMVEEIENLYGKPTELTERAREFLGRHYGENSEDVAIGVLEPHIDACDVPLMCEGKDG